MFYGYDNINEDAAIIQVEIEPTAIGRYFPVSLGIWGDARDTAKQLTARLGTMADRQKAEAWVSTYKKEREDFLQARDRDADMTSPIQPSGLFKAMRDVFPADAMVTMDAGTLCLQATDALQYGGPRSLLPAVWPCRLFVCLRAGSGSPARPPGHQPDGRWRFRHDHLGLSTAVDYGINSVTVVMNNGCWGAEKAYRVISSMVAISVPMVLTTI